LCGGILSALAASLLTVVVWLTHSTWHGLFLHRSCTTLFFLMIPLLVFGAHCLDLLDTEDEGKQQ
ncbi:MAG TPA: hypothetical protein VGJ37_04645, partial [Pyrinomonadaceae bacterium]